MMRPRKIVRPAMLFAMALSASIVATVPASAQNVTDGVCSDARRKDGEPQTVPLKDYTVALVSNTIKREGNNRVVAKATALFNAGLKRGIYPVVNDQDDIWFQCQNPILPETMRSMRDVSMETPGPGEADELVAKLKALTDPGIVLKAKDASSWPTFIVFAKNSFQSPGSVGGAMPILEPLFRRYKGIHQQPAFLTGIPFPVTVTTSFAQWSYMPPSGVVFDGSATSQPGNSQQAAGPQQGPVQQQGNSRPQQGQKQQLPSRGAPLPPPQPSAQGAVAGPPPSIQKSAVDVTIRFRSNHDQWQKLLDPERLRSDPGIFETFSYCANLTAAGAGAYKMQCILRPDHKVPVRIRGFKELLIDADGPPLDDQLKVVGFSYPYPASWSRPQTGFVEVEGGNLREVLARGIRLSQGIAGCQTEIAAVSLENIVSASFTPFPTEPCKAYEVSFQQITLSPNASVLRGCVAGAPDQPVTIRNNKVTCWAQAGQAEKPTLSVHLLDGFNPVTMPLSTIEGDSTSNFELLAAGLQPLWPYAPGIVDLREAPAYEARSVQYVVDGGAPCGRPVQLSGGAAALPSLKDAGCGQVPRGMTISLQQNGAAQTASSPPPEAFEPGYDDRIEFASLAQGRTVPVDQLKRQLPVQFSAEDARTFDAQFGIGAGNSAMFAGVYLFQGNCTRKSEGKFVPFNGPPTSAAYKWPIKAAVFDSSEDPLTLCTTATVGGVQSRAPYLTFALRGARATGLRRAIVVAMSPNVATRGGSTVVKESLRTFVDHIGGEVAKGGRLSPINVFQVNGAGEFKQLFTGEAAAQDPNAVKQLITQSQENVAPVTPDFRQLRLIPELKKDSVQNFDRVIFVMDGSDAAQDNMDVLAGLANQFKNPDSIQLLMIGNCNPWLQQNQNIKCTQLPADASQRPDILVKAFATFINRADAQAMDPQAELRSSVQPPPPPPAPEPQGGARAPAPQPRKH